MKDIISRLPVLVLAVLLLGIAAFGVTGLLLPGGQWPAVIAVTAGLLLAVLPLPSGRSLATLTAWFVTTEGLTVVLVPHVVNAAAVSGLPVHAGVGGVGASTIAVMVTLLTALSACCGWLLFSGHTPWPVVTLAASGVLIRADVTRVYEERFPLFVIAAVLLVVLTYSRGMHRLRIALPAALVGAIVVALSWQLPAYSHNGDGIFTDPMSSLAHSRSGPPGAASEQTLDLGGAFHPNNRTVMAIALDHPLAQPYWQVLVFDHYDGHGWTVGPLVQRFAAAGATLSQNRNANPSLLQATVQLDEQAQDLVFPGVPESASLATLPRYPTGGARPLELPAETVLPPGTIYRVLVSTDETAPEPWSALQRDLQLPPEPSAISDLAQQLVRRQPSVLERALAIDAFLRDSGRFTYDIRAGSPPGHDAVTDFLFHSRRGYCNQFSTALAVLARSVGIPARIVTGYASGAYFNGSYTVRERDAHSWVEIYDPARGWVLLDPTPGFGADPRTLLHSGAGPVVPGSSTIRPLPTVQTPSGLGYRRRQSQPALQAPVPAAATSPTLPIIPLGALFLALIAAVLYVRWPRTVPQLYRSLVVATPRRYGHLRSMETAADFAERFRRRDGEYADIRLLVDLYLRHAYARQEPTAHELRMARRAWWRVRGRWLLHPLRS